MTPRLRFLLVLLCGLGAQAAAAQESPVVNRPDLDPAILNAVRGGFEPDTTSPWRYYPLAVGNTWEYREETDRVYRVHIPSDTLLLGVRYFKRVYSAFSPGGAPLHTPRTDFVRFDTTTSYVMRIHLPTLTEDVFYDATCPFVAPTGGDFECMGGIGFIINFTQNGILQFSDITVTGVTVKTYYKAAGEFRYAVDFGEVFRWPETDPWFGLVFARLDGQTFGTELYPVSSEPGPLASQPSDRALAVWPNPTRDRLSIGVGGYDEHEVNVSVYDLLGRRVVDQHFNLGTGSDSVVLDLSGVAPGAYVVRLTGSRGPVGSALVTRLEP